MKTIFILRHAKSSWKNPGLSDHDRPLNGRGKKDAPLMATLMEKLNYKPDAIICSTSQRTRETVSHIIKAFEIESDKIIFEEGLYHGYMDDYEEAIKEVDDECKSVLIVGHNPTITYIANTCMGDSLDNVPTCGLLVIESPSKKWKYFSFVESHLTKVHFPKMYK